MAKILSKFGEQQLVMVNYACGLNQSETGKYFEWIIIDIIKQLLDEVEHDIMSYQNRGLCYLPKPKAEADNTDTRFW